MSGKSKEAKNKDTNLAVHKSNKEKIFQNVETSDVNHLTRGEPNNNEILTEQESESSATTESSKWIPRRENHEEDKNTKYKIFNEDYQDNLMDEIFIV